MFGIGKTTTVVATALILGLVGTAGAARNATPEEASAMAVAIFGEENPYVSAKVSTVDARWGMAISSIGVKYAMRWTGSGWALAGDTSGENCTSTRQLGVPVKVIDDLGLLAVRFKCASPPPLIPCLTGSAFEGNYTYLKKPRGCNVEWPLHAAEQLGGGVFAFRKMRWVTWTRSRAVARAWFRLEVPLIDPVEGTIRVEFWRPREASSNGFAFTRFRVLSSNGRRPITQAYPIRWED